MDRLNLRDYCPAALFGRLLGDPAPALSPERLPLPFYDGNGAGGDEGDDPVNSQFGGLLDHEFHSLPLQEGLAERYPKRRFPLGAQLLLDRQVHSRLVVLTELGPILPTLPVKDRHLIPGAKSQDRKDVPGLPGLQGNPFIPYTLWGNIDPRHLQYPRNGRRPPTFC